MQGLKSAILAIFLTGLGWPCTVSAALKNPSQDFKNLFALGTDEFLVMLEGKIRVTQQCGIISHGKQCVKVEERLREFYLNFSV